MLHSNLTIKNGHLFFAGMDTVELAKKYGTPLMLLDEGRVRENAKTYVEAMKKHFGKGSMPLYASKALSFTGIYKIIKECGMGIDIVSSGELYTALKAGFPLENAFFHGNNKTDFDIQYGLEHKIGYFVVDNIDELNRLSDYAAKMNISQKILLRITPGIDPHTHKAITTGNVDSKFGSAIETGQAEEIVKLALSKKNITLCGFHCHIGSQIFECDPFIDAANIMIDFIHTIKNKLGYEAKILNLGGGFGVRYVESHPKINVEKNIEIIANAIKAKCESLGVNFPTILMEPGRSIVADAGLTLYTVGAIKQIPGFKNYVAIDGGMTDNPRYALYQSPYSAIIANKADQKADFVCTIAGRCCESGDLIQENIALTKPERGDILAVLVTGAYNYSMASNYNRIPRPPIVIVKGGVARVSVRRETFSDLCACDAEEDTADIEAALDMTLIN